MSGRLRVSVWDTSPDVPPPFATGVAPRLAPGADCESGRGLLLVRLYAANWGGHAYSPHVFGPDAGKTLWFELAPPPQAAYEVAA